MISTLLFHRYTRWPVYRDPLLPKRRISFLPHLSMLRQAPIELCHPSMDSFTRWWHGARDRESLLLANQWVLPTNLSSDDVLAHAIVLPRRGFFWRSHALLGSTVGMWVRDIRGIWYHRRLRFWDYHGVGNRRIFIVFRDHSLLGSLGFTFKYQRIARN